jgi:zinc/manganese transport system permease protein
VLYRPLTFASVDAEVAEARGVRTRLVGTLFLFVLALTVTEAAQIVGTLLVLSLAITPAAAAQRLTARPALVTALSIAFALLASDGGLLASLQVGNVKASVFVTAISFGLYLIARALGAGLRAGRRG